MANHIKQLLNTWYPDKNKLQWILATIIGTEGSSYRKPGAMMMINSMGQYYGLLSGGCLESDIMRQSRRCWETGKNKIIQYDMRDEEDLAWQLGIGCGGLVRILLQVVNADNNYLSLPTLREHINQNRACEYKQVLNEEAPLNVVNEELESQSTVFVHNIQPPPHIAIFGGGADAVPVVSIAANLGWQITLLDPRPSYARASDFPGAHLIVKDNFNTLQNAHCLGNISAAVIMTHNIELDAQALMLVQQSGASYTGLLGPRHRTERVLQHAKTSFQRLSKPLANPIGLRIGGELPESIALSILSEIHAYLAQTDAQSISQILPNQCLVSSAG